MASKDVLDQIVRLMSKEESKGYSIQDASKQLSVPENTLRKYLSYFSIKVSKAGRKTILTDEAIQCLTEIIHLKSNGWSLKQIKELRENPEKAKEAKEAQQEINKHSPQGEETIDESNVAETNAALSAKDENIEEKANSRVNVIADSPKQKILQEEKFEDSEQYSEDSENNEDKLAELKEAASVIKPPLTKDFVNKEIASQAKRASRLYRYLGSRHSPRDTAEVKADLDRRVIFLNGLRYLRDNWLDRKTGVHESPKELVKA